MSVFTSVGIIVFSLLVMLFLQLVPGVFAIFYHTLAGKFSKKRTAHIALFFILGVESAFALIFLLCYIFANLIFTPALLFAHEIWRWIAVGIMLALGIFCAVSYFRPGPGTKLFISRALAHKYQTRTNTITTRSGAFFLGFATIIPEFCFTLPLILLSAVAITALQVNALTCATIIMLFILITILPLIIFYVASSQGANLADFLRSRFKYKPFVRFIIPLSYFTIALFILLGATI